MIIKHTLPTNNEYGSRFHQGEATLAYFAGHGEYWFDELHGPRGLQFTLKVQKWDVYVAEEEGTKAPNWVKALPDYEPEGWGTFVRISGPVYDLWHAFYTLTHQLDPEFDPADYTPGGDDDTFDYYPSGFAWAAEWAKDLDELDEKFATQPPIVSPNGVTWRFEKHAFTARHRIEDIVAKLLIAKGPFAEWEFEYHAAEYTKEEA